MAYFVRLTMSRRRIAFVRGNMLGRAVIALPLLRLMTLLSALNRHPGGSLRGKVRVYVTGAMTWSSSWAALAMLDAERQGWEPNRITR